MEDIFSELNEIMRLCVIHWGRNINLRWRYKNPKNYSTSQQIEKMKIKTN